MILHILNSVEENPLTEGVFGCAKLIIRASGTKVSLAFFYGFFDWFSNPSRVAHLATEKEQSRILRQIIYDNGLRGKSLELGNISAIASYTREACLFFNTLIKQYLLQVLAMSTLTTSDLEGSLSYFKKYCDPRSYPTSS